MAARSGTTALEETELVAAYRPIVTYRAPTPAIPTSVYVAMRIVAVVGCIAASVGAAVLVNRLGYWSLAIPLYCGMAGLAIFFPLRGAAVALLLGIVFEPSVTDFSHPMSLALYQLPPGWEHVLPMTVSPLELFVALMAVGVLLHPKGPRPEVPLPVVATLVPVLVVCSFLYGAYKGGKVSIGYDEAHGIIFGTAAFIVARRLSTYAPRQLLPTCLTATAALAVVVLARYFALNRSGAVSFSLDGVYAHEDAIFLASGFVLAAAALFVERRRHFQLLLCCHNILILIALFATGRRVGTLVLVAGILALGFFLARRKPALTVAISIPVLLAAAAYLGTNWNRQYGIVAQPARAIRSQFDPSVRDSESDIYRATEAFDVIQTVKANPVFGVGFGRPFIQYRPLPSLVQFWPQQLYTPHENVLWLVLKFGVLGASVVIGMWVLAMKRCIMSVREAKRSSGLPVLPIVLGAVLLMYFANAQVDLALVNSRSAMLLGVVLGAAFSLPQLLGGDPTP
jgi:O-Antigen ligase